ncbi:hypothetical protein ACFU3J_05180 [Streptomyces sp. NPDC057411]|uniref:hypothetical protein n=1 Tax=unclassified Streptomyces TaxID=2593676 RepID=UPI003640EA89
MKIAQRTLVALALAGAASLSVAGAAHADGVVGRDDSADVTADGLGRDVNKGVGKLLLHQPLAAVEGVNTGHVI